MAKIAIVGAGIIGLTSAYSLKLFDENLDVTVFAEKFSPETTSDGAAGIFALTEGPSGMRDTPVQLLRRWANDSYIWYKENCKKARAPKMGISCVSGYWLSDEDSIDAKVWLSIVDHQQLTAMQLEEFGPDIKSGVAGTTFVCESRKYLPWLLDRFIEKNGRVVRRKIDSFHELASFDILINCSGLGAIHLCNDRDLGPRRGQIARVKAPWIRHFYHVEYSKAAKPHVAYIYPNIENIVIGGTSDNSWDLNVSEEKHNTIFERTKKLVPSLEYAEFAKDWVGLRPSRPSVRLERENMMLQERPSEAARRVAVIHNYGHGPCGVTLSWGCAQHTVELAKECLKEIGNVSTKSKL